MSSHIVSVRSDDPCIDGIKILLSDVVRNDADKSGYRHFPVVSPRTFEGIKSYIVAGTLDVSEDCYDVQRNGLCVNIISRKREEV